MMEKVLALLKKPINWKIQMSPKSNMKQLAGSNMKQLLSVGSLKCFRIYFSSTKAKAAMY